MDAERNLRALVDRIIPGDDYPSGWQAGVGDFIRAILITDLEASAPLVEAGLDLLAREAHARYEGLDFADLPPVLQDRLIGDLLEGRTTVAWGATAPDEFARLIVRLVAQGFYGDPGNGGNRDAVSWAMVGYRALPEGAGWPALAATPLRTTSWVCLRNAFPGHLRHTPARPRQTPVGTRRRGPRQTGLISRLSTQKPSQIARFR